MGEEVYLWSTRVTRFLQASSYQGSDCLRADSDVAVIVQLTLVACSIWVQIIVCSPTKWHGGATNQARYPIHRILNVLLSCAIVAAFLLACILLRAGR